MPAPAKPYPPLARLCAAAARGRLSCALLFLAVLLCARPATAAADDSIFVYDVFAGAPTCAEIEARISSLELRPTVLLSIEQGREFELASADGIERVRCALHQLRPLFHKHTVKLLLLQDPGYLDDLAEATNRMRLVAAFARDNPGVAGVVVDVEPYAHPDWECGTVEQHRQLVARFLEVLRQSRAAVQPLPLEAVVPWWSARLDEVPEFQPPQVMATVSGVFVMLYSDEGGPVWGTTSERIAKNAENSSSFFRAGSHVHLLMARYESRSGPDLEQDLRRLRKQYAGKPGFAGVGVFHAGNQYDAPLVRMLSSAVLDSQGMGLPDVTITSAYKTVHSSPCGNFSLRGMPGENLTLVVSKPGFRDVTVQVTLKPPGRATEVPPIRLEPVTP